MTDKIIAPFTHKQVISINQYQVSGFTHPFTCTKCRDTFDVGTNEYKLVATLAGFICPTCDSTQDWCHTFMADDSWIELNPWPEEAKNHVV